MVLAITAAILTTLTLTCLTIFSIIQNNFLIKQLKTMALKQTEVAAELVAFKGQVVKIFGEVSAKLTALETALANQENASPEVEAALADLKTSIQAVDDLNPDAPVVTPGEETPTE